MGRSREFDENVVLQKAMELFWKQGYEKTSMNDLVEHMGIHRRSLYDTFGDKHTLYLKVIDHYGEYYTDKIKTEVLSAETVNQAIQFIFDYMIEASEDRPCGCLLVNAATELASQDKEVEEKAEEAFLQAEHFLAELIRKGQETGEFPLDLDADALAEVLHNNMLGIRVRTKTTAKKENLHRIANFCLELLKK